MTQSGRPVEDGVDLCSDGIDTRHPIHGADEAALPVIGKDRSGLGAIFGHARAHRLLIVVGAAPELGRPTGVAYARNLGRMEGLMVAGTALGAAEAAGDALHQFILVDHKFNNVVEASAPLLEQHVERLGLVLRAWKAV